MATSDDINKFHVQLGQAGQNIRLLDATIQTAIVNAERSGDYDEAQQLSSFEAEIDVLKDQSADTGTPDDDKTLEDATSALITLNKKMTSIINSNKNTANLIADISDLINNGTNLWQAATKK